jgi:hypothetical protein
VRDSRARAHPSSRSPLIAMNVNFYHGFCVHLQMLLMSQVSRRSLVRNDDDRIGKCARPNWPFDMLVRDEAEAV